MCFQARRGELSSWVTQRSPSLSLHTEPQLGDSAWGEAGKTVGASSLSLGTTCTCSSKWKITPGWHINTNKPWVGNQHPELLQYIIWKIMKHARNRKAAPYPGIKAGNSSLWETSVGFTRKTSEQLLQTCSRAKKNHDYRVKTWWQCCIEQRITINRLKKNSFVTFNKNGVLLGAGCSYKPGNINYHW